MSRATLCEPYAPWTACAALRVCVRHMLGACESESDSERRREAAALLALLSHDVSEVREGVARGVSDHHTRSQSDATRCVSCAARGVWENLVLSETVKALQKEKEPELVEVLLTNLNVLFCLSLCVCVFVCICVCV